jgi:hypothetical protein
VDGELGFSGAKGGWRTTGGLEFGHPRSLKPCRKVDDVRVKLLTKPRCVSPLGLRPADRGHPAITAVTTAGRVADDELADSRIVAVVRCGANAARVRRRSSHRQANRGQVPHYGEEQKQPGSQTMHAFRKSDPKGRLQDRRGNIQRARRRHQASIGWGPAPLQTYLPTMSPLRPETAARTSFFSFSGTLNLSSVAVKSFTEALQSSSVIPSPVCAVFISRPR